MSGETLPDGSPWVVVRVVGLSPSRRRLEYLLPPGRKAYATIDRELDTPARRQTIAETLISERTVAMRPRGPVARGPAEPSQWISS